MVSKIRYNALPKLKEKNIKQKLIYILILGIGIVLTVLSKGDIVFFIFLGIVLFGILRAIFNSLFDDDHKINKELKVREN
jgi:hypothetical protein